MKYLFYLMIFAFLFTSCNEGPKTFSHYDEKTGEMRIDTIPYYDLRDFPEIRNSKNIDSLIIGIVNTDWVYERAVGMAGSYTRQYARFERLHDLLSDKEMFELIKHKNPVVRAYAFKALQMDNSRYLEKAKIELINDTAKINTMDGCGIVTIKISEFIKYNY